MGGWRVIRTLGKGLTEISTPQGFAAEAASATTILVSSHMGFALSTTQVCSGSIIGTGLGKKGSKVNWGVAGKMLIAWIVTFPAAGIVGALACALAEDERVGHRCGRVHRVRRRVHHLALVPSQPNQFRKRQRASRCEGQRQPRSEDRRRSCLASA